MISRYLILRSILTELTEFQSAQGEELPTQLPWPFGCSVPHMPWLSRKPRGFTAKFQSRITLARLVELAQDAPQDGGHIDNVLMVAVAVTNKTDLVECSRICSHYYDWPTLQLQYVLRLV